MPRRRTPQPPRPSLLRKSHQARDIGPEVSPAQVRGEMRRRAYRSTPLLTVEMDPPASRAIAAIVTERFSLPRRTAPLRPATVDHPGLARTHPCVVGSEPEDHPGDIGRDEPAR
jgi:hypothetical protein